MSKKETLSARRERLNRPFTEMETLSFVTPLIKNIRDLHAAGRYHLRLRPEHIEIDEQGNVTVDHACTLDFHKVPMSDQDWERMDKVKNRGFAPKEQRNWEPKEIGPWTDFYALGAVLCSMLGPDMALGRKNELSEDLSPELRKFIYSLMSVNPDKRMKAVENFNAMFPGVWPMTVAPYAASSGQPDTAGQGGASLPPLPPEPPATCPVEPVPEPVNPQFGATPTPPLPPEGREYGNDGNTGEGPRDNKGNKKTILIIVAAVAVVLLGVGAWFLFKPDDRPVRHDYDEEETETVASENTEEVEDREVSLYPIVNVFLRSTPSSADNYNKVTLMKFGSRVVQYDYSDGWVRGLYVPANGRGQSIEGYAAAPFLINEHDFNLLNGLLGNDVARQVIGTAKTRQALVNYFNERGLMGRYIPDDGSRPSSTLSNQWQVVLSSVHGPNEVYMERVLDSRSPFTDFAVILNNMETGENRLVYFRFDADETPHFVAEANVGTFNNIYSIKRSSGSQLEYDVRDDYGDRETGYMRIQ